MSEPSRVSCRSVVAWVLLALGLMGAAPVVAQTRIAVLQDANWQRDFFPLELTRREILALAGEEFAIRFPAELQVTADGSLQGVRAALQRLLADPSVDLVLAIGPVASTAAGQLAPPARPVIAPVVIDAALQGLPFDQGGSGVRNFNYLVSVGDFVQSVSAFEEIVRFRHLGVLIDDRVLDAMPGLSAATAAFAAERGYRVSLIRAGSDLPGLLGAIPQDLDAVMLTPLADFDAPTVARLAESLRRRDLPSFSLHGPAEVELGIMASLALPADRRLLARRVALNVQRVLLGEDPGGFEVTLPRRSRLTLNLSTLAALDVWPSWELLSEAEQIQPPESDAVRRWSLADSLAAALRIDPELQAARIDVEIAATDTELAQARRRPQLDGELLWRQIDEDRAAASLGSEPERAADASLSLSQLLYSEAANAGVEINRHRQRSSLAEVEADRLDLALEVALAYFDVLRARTLERVQSDNVSTTRVHRDMADVRRRIGVAGPGEVFRWQRELADARRALVAAVSGRRQAETAFNRLLRRPLQEPFELEPVGLESPGMLMNDPRLRSRVRDPRGIAVLEAFLGAEAVARSPSIQALDAAIEAQQRAVVAARRGRWAPVLSAQARIGERLSAGGAGSDFAPPAGLGGDSDDTTWSLGLNLRLPLSAGGALDGEYERARQQLRQLQARREALVEATSARVLVAMQATHASYPSMGLTRDAADAAARNLAVVSDAYRQGLVSIVEVIDAQNAARASDEAAAAAVYDFLADLVRAQRAAGVLGPLMAAAERERWFERLVRFAAEFQPKVNLR